jgi:PAS domain S-box-containing protein
MADQAADTTRTGNRITVSIRAKMVIALTLLILLLLGVAYHGVDRLATDQVKEELERQLLTVAQATAAGIDGEAHQALVASDLPGGRPLEDPRYRALVEWLALVQTTHGTAPVEGGAEDYHLYVYTYVAGPAPGSVLLIGSSGAVEAEPRGAEFREPLVDPSETLLTGLTEPITRVDSVVRDRWGVWVTAATPIEDRSGRPVGAVGVDMRDTTVVALQNRIRHSLLPTFIAAGGVVLITGLLGSTYISRPIRQLTAAAERIATEEGVGEDEPPLPGARVLEDEITSLVTAWEAMLARMREREASLVYSEERYRALLDSLPGPAFLCDQLGHMTYISPQIEDLLQITPDEWIGTDGLGWIELVNPEDWGSIQEAFDHPAETPEVGIFEVRFSRRDGEPHWIEGRYARFLTQGDEWLVAGIILDIQARKEAQQKLLAYNRELQIAYEELQEAQQQLVRSAQLVSIGELAATVAHEINNPLAAVRGLAQILMSERGDDPDLREPLEQIATNTERMARTVRTLQSLGRQGPAELERTLVNPIVADAAALVQAQLDDHAIKLRTELADNLPPVQGVTHLLEQVVINLLTNARDAILEKGRPGTITLRTDLDVKARHVRLGVTDTGVGIPAEDREKLFRPFFTTKPHGQGTGLGLPICYRIVQQHGGHIHFTSELGVGTTFTVLLPASDLAEPV